MSELSIRSAVSRRAFLRLTALAGGSALLAACQQQPAPASKPAETKPAEADGSGQAQSKGEADVLRGLSDRRVELDAR